MKPSRFAMGLTWSDIFQPQAVEKAGPWKPRKTNPRFPSAPTAPWKTRNGSEFPTFPPPRPFFLSPNPNPRRRGYHETHSGHFVCYQKRTDSKATDRPENRPEEMTAQFREETRFLGAPSVPLTYERPATRPRVE